MKDLSETDELTTKVLSDEAAKNILYTLQRACTPDCWNEDTGIPWVLRVPYDDRQLELVFVSYYVTLGKNRIMVMQPSTKPTSYGVPATGEILNDESPLLELVEKVAKQLGIVYQRVRYVFMPRDISSKPPVLH